MTLSELLTGLRAWLGFRPAPVARVSHDLAWPALWLGDILGWLGWPSPLRSTALRQMDHFVAGDSEAWAAATALSPLGFKAFLARHPASLADRWHARLYFVRPLAVFLLGAFWLLTGLISLGPGRHAAIALLERAHYGSAAAPVVLIGAVWDSLLGLALWWRSWTRVSALLMIATTLGYLGAGSLTLPGLWADPLGPWLKVVPLMALCLFVAATQEER